jgi:hypothetical protein
MRRGPLSRKKKVAVLKINVELKIKMFYFPAVNYSISQTIPTCHEPCLEMQAVGRRGRRRRE